MNGRQLISCAIENALASPYIDQIVVSSDSEEILAFATQYDSVLVLDRDSKLPRTQLRSIQLSLMRPFVQKHYWALRLMWL